MNNIACALLLVLLLLCTPMPTFTTTPASGPSASGVFQFTLEDGVDRSVEFNARTQRDGRTIGEMTFADAVGIPNPESDSTTNSPITGIYVKATFDCLVVKGNKAVMSGVVTETNVGDFNGQRVLLVVEDGGEGVNAPDHDRLTWGVYQAPNKNWLPQDAEVPNDNGALLDWLATDSERTDDVGISAKRSEVIGCQTFPLASYSFVDVRDGQGNIQVKP